MDAQIIESQLSRIGSDAYVYDGERVFPPVRCMISHLWRRKSTAFEPTYTELGRLSREYYLYIGPASFDILSLSEDAYVIFAGNRFSFRNRDAVTVGGRVVYYTGILRKTGKESEDDN